jgi:cell fate regulator YaaT (PSP1 superfamily)
VGGPQPDKRRRGAAGGGRRRGGHRPDDGRGREPAPAPAPDEPLVLVQFKGNRKSYYHNRAGVELQVGQYCLVEADRGRDMGRVVYIGPGTPAWWQIAGAQGVLQAAGAADLARLHQNRGDEWDFWDICQEKILYRKLNMNLVTVERQFDHKKITFYFTAEKRVDFRELVRDLAAVFRTRIELRQIGVRDEARLKGGLGVCGREFCCASFLHDFVPVTLKMAKVQQLPLNPSKLSGPCGRLRCCLTYENETYRDARQVLPKVGTVVTGPDGSGPVRKVDLLQRLVTVDLGGDTGLRTWPVDDVSWERGGDLPRPRRERGGGCGKDGGGRGGRPGDGSGQH